MERYIDADALIRLIEIDAVCNGGNFSKRDVIGSIKALPTADVVPKSEVEHLEREVRLLTENSITVKYPHCVLGSYYAVLTKSIEDYNKVIADISSVAKAEVAREIFEEIYKVMNSLYLAVQHSCVGMHGDNPETMRFIGKLEGVTLLGDEIAELKKKYTEESK